jgi:tricorn protease-like protein
MTFSKSNISVTHQPDHGWRCDYYFVMSCSARSMGFVGVSRPFLVTLNAARTDPFVDHPLLRNEIKAIVHRMQMSFTKEQKDIREPRSSEVQIDLIGINYRILAFHVRPGYYRQVLGLPQKRVLYLRDSLELDLGGQLLMQYDFLSNSEQAIAKDIASVMVSKDGSVLSFSIVATKKSLY